MKIKKVSFFDAFKMIVWSRKKNVFIGLILILLGRISTLAIPEASKYLIDDVVANKDIGKLKIILTVILAAIIIQSISSFLLTRTLTVEAQFLITEMRIKVYNKILTLPISFFNNNSTGKIVSRIMSDPEGIKNLLGTGFVQLFGGSITVIVSLVLLFRINHIMALSVLLPLILFVLVGIKALGKIRPVFTVKAEKNAQVTGRLTESINGIRIVKGFNLETKENSIFKSIAFSLFRTVKKSHIYTAALSSIGTLILGVTTVTIMGVGGLSIMNGDMTFGEFLSFTIYLGFIFAPIMQMSEVGSQIMESLAGLDRTQTILDHEVENSKNRTITLDAIKGDVKFRNVYFTYDDENFVLKDISFSIKKGKTVALIGPSGAGKSTIASLLTSFISPSQGLIEIDGKDLSKVTLESYRKHLGLVLQDDFLFDGTIRDNITFFDDKYTEEELEQAISISHVKEFTDKMELGLDTVVGERGIKLSGGQRQRISLARAILSRPSIIILDEATSNLDTESERLIQEGLSELIKEKTTLIIAHRLSTIKKADQIIVIENGVIIEKGTHEELIQKRERYFDLYTFQAKI